MKALKLYILLILTAFTLSAYAQLNIRNGIALGMSAAQVQQKEDGHQLKLAGGSALTYVSTHFGIRCRVKYSFKNDLLSSVYIKFRITNQTNKQYISDYNTLVNALNKKYGKPADSKTAWKGDDSDTGQLAYSSVWKLENYNTEITLRLSGSGKRCNITLTYEPLS